ncbi:MAG: PAS domain S-box protein [Firmicutes bacterium]|jgi:diguanylate cyclase (GGDEF)-like protein/PAS domain S-box-containing protein|nr:PAS domain S-box protein [Bacillota bacterium]
MNKLLYSIMVLILVFSTISYSDDVFKGPSNMDIDSHGSVMLIIKFDTGEITYGNKAALDFYGYPESQFIGMHIDSINTLSKEEVQKEMRLAKEEKRHYFLFQHKLMNGEIRNVEVYSSPINNGGEVYLFSVIHDITPRILAEQEADKRLKIINAMIGILVIVTSIFLFRENRSKRHFRQLSQRYDSLFSNMKEGFALHEIVVNKLGKPIDYIFLDVNKAFEEITGLMGDEILGHSVKKILPETEEYWIRNYGQVALEGNSMSFEEFSLALGKYFKVNVYSPIKGQFITVFTDITKERESQIEMENEKALLETTLYSLSDGVISTDLHGSIEHMNTVAEELTGFDIEEVKGKAIDVIYKVIGESNETTVENIITKVLKSKEKIKFASNSYLISKSGEKKPIEENASPIINSEGEIIGAVVVFRDFTDKKEKIDKITYLSYHDQLTGLYNRRFFEEELERIDVKENLPISLLMIDVNGLKLTNDAFGHKMGDRLLMRVSDVLKKVCSKNNKVARIGGDEFVVLLPQTNSSETEKIITCIKNELRGTMLENIVISVSIGYEVKNDITDNINEVYLVAEEKMYRKKLTESQSMRNSTIKVILKTLNESNERERLHSDKVSKWSVKLGEKIGLTSEELKELEVAGLMHDIGKIAINNSYLDKAEKLTEFEYEEVKKHSEIGYHILKSVDEYTDLAEYSLCHHERWDGKGYPRGLKGETIPLFARIITIADAFEAMTSDRPYREAMSEKMALEELKKCSGSQFDPKLVEEFLELFDIY